MKVGDLVTLSSYCLWSAPMWRWRDRIWKQKKPLVGLVVQVKKNPHQRTWTSKNEAYQYYINWMCGGPVSRYGYTPGYFWRNDLKFVRGKK